MVSKLYCSKVKTFQSKNPKERAFFLVFDVFITWVQGVSPLDDLDKSSDISNRIGQIVGSL